MIEQWQEHAATVAAPSIEHIHDCLPATVNGPEPLTTRRPSLKIFFEEGFILIERQVGESPDQFFIRECGEVPCGHFSTPYWRSTPKPNWSRNSKGFLADILGVSIHRGRGWVDHSSR